jgi:hypothetical protein
VLILVFLRDVEIEFVEEKKHFSILFGFFLEHEKQGKKFKKKKKNIYIYILALHLAPSD